MTIEKYVSGMRAGLNERARNLGNKIYGGLGDSLASDVDLVKGAKRGVAVLTLLGVAGLNSGCVTPAGKRFGEGLVKSGIRAHVIRNAENESDAQYAGKIEEARQEYRAQANPIEHKRKLIVQYWKDFNGNEKLDKGENLGDIDGPIDFSKYNIRVELRTNSGAPISFFALDSDGDRIAFVGEHETNNWYNDSSKDWIGNLHEAGKNKAGKYTIYARQNGCSKVFKKSITTVRNKNNLPVN